MPLLLLLSVEDTLFCLFISHSCSIFIESFFRLSDFDALSERMDETGKA